MNYAGLKTFTIENGTGVRVSLFVSGCRHHCRDCFNAETWDFHYGMPFTEDTENEILLSSNHSTSTVNIDTLYQILQNSSMYSKELSFLSKDMQLFFAFLLSTVFYPNLAIASKAYFLID